MVIAAAMSKEVEFFFYVGAAVCFVLAALGEGWKYGRRTRSGLAPQLVLLPLGLLLWLIPLLWNTGDIAF
jgi:hypothetical protein